MTELGTINQFMMYLLIESGESASPERAKEGARLLGEPDSEACRLLLED